MPATTTAAIKTLLAKADAIGAKAEAENRDLTGAERAEINRLFTEAKAQRQLADLRTFTVDPGELNQRAPGAGGVKAVPGPWAEPARRLGAKALDPTGSITLPPAWDGGIEAFSRRSLLNLFPRRPLTDTDRFAFLRQTVRDNQAAAVEKGKIKPTSVVSLERVEDRVRTVATLSEPIPRQDLADIASLEEFLDVELRGMVLTEIDDQIVSGDGAGENMVGLLNTSGRQVQTFDTDQLTTIRKAITKVRTAYGDSGLEPDAVLVNPLDAETLDLTKDVEGRFYFGGPVGGRAGEVWRVRVVESAAVPAGIGIVGAFAASVRVYTREEVRVDWSEHLPTVVDAVDTSLFAANLRQYRAEARVGLAVTRPIGIVEVDLTAGS